MMLLVHSAPHPSFESVCLMCLQLRHMQALDHRTKLNPAFACFAAVHGNSLATEPSVTTIDILGWLGRVTMDVIGEAGMIASISACSFPHSLPQDSATFLIPSCPQELTLTMPTSLRMSLCTPSPPSFPPSTSLES